MTDSGANWTVITGSTGGLGREIAAQLAARGDALILVNRSRTKAEAQREELRASRPDLPVELVTADLMDIADAAERIAALPGRIDALYNNAGVLTARKTLSAQGYESQFAVNVLAAYLLILKLRAKMARPADAPPAIIVNMSSSAINPLKSLQLSSLPDPDKVGGLMTTYAQTKLAATALAPALADDLKADGILIRAVDPGATRTPMTTGGNPAMPKILAWLAPVIFAAPDKQAAKVVRSADPAAFDGATGIYVANLKRRKLPAPAADASNQRALIKLLDERLAT
ncbi:MAG: SDR family NAD(P)-dependent oxidoreductase [Pseudomonadota bacterium]